MDCEEEVDFYDSDYEEDYYDNDDDDDDDDDVYAEEFCNKVDDNDAVDDGECVFGVSNTSKSKKTYTNLKEDDLRRKQEEEISNISSILSIHEVAASKLLHYYNWNVSQVHDEWFTDEARVREKVGLPSASVLPLTDREESAVCGICFDRLPIEDFYPMVCGHLYCNLCWNQHITISINDGPGCLMLRCPEPSCSVAVCRDMIDDLVGEEERRKYSRYFLRSFVEVGKKIKWCPAPGCENAVELELGDGVFEVTCLCSHTFCWNCGEDAHRPLKCDTVAKWVLKNSSESENTAWILANSKCCPKCTRPIEKNHGCMHMTCTPPCKFEFCWLCLGNWKHHGQTTGGFYSCNIFEAEKKTGKYSEEERIREMAKTSVEKYTHYYERWASNQKSRNQAIQDLHNIQSVSLKKLSDWAKEPESQLRFIPDAWKQIIECRRVLKWTYAYGYYMPEDDETNKKFFEYLQGDAERNLDRLHECAEKDFNAFSKFLQSEDENPPTEECAEKDFNAFSNSCQSEDENPPTEEDFINFRNKLMDLTNVTHSYFTKLVAYLETWAT